MNRPPIDLRDHARQTKKRIVAAGLVLVILFGTVLIALIYGTPAAGCGLTFFAAMLIPVASIVLILFILERFLDRSDKS